MAQKLKKVICLRCQKQVGLDYKITSIVTCQECAGKKKTFLKKKKFSTLTENYARVKSAPALDLPSFYHSYIFRSGWERNFARYLHHKGLEFEYESAKCQVVFPGFKNAPHRYLIDFYVPAQDKFYEVKGMFLGKDRMKAKRLKKLHPSIFDKFAVVISNKNTKANKFYSFLKVPILYIEDVVQELKDNFLVCE